MFFRQFFQNDLLRRSHRVLRIAVLFLVASLGVTSTNRAQVSEQLQTKRKVPRATLSGLASGQEQDVIVLFDDSAVERQASEMRRSAGIRTNDQSVLDFKSTRFMRFEARTFWVPSRPVKSQYIEITAISR